MEKRLVIELRMTQTQVRYGLVLLTVLSLPLELGSETITFSTTYPSPVGIYHRLITTGSQGSPSGDTLLARDGGRVGIGTTDPHAKLDVNGVVSVGNYNANPPPISGGIYYNPTANSGTGQFLGSDGSTWGPMGGNDLKYFCHQDGVLYFGGWSPVDFGHKYVCLSGAGCWWFSCNAVTGL